MRHRHTYARHLAKSGLVLAGVLVGFVSHSVTGLEPSLVALLGAGALVALADLDITDALADVEWPTLVFFMGLFVMGGPSSRSGWWGR